MSSKQLAHRRILLPALVSIIGLLTIGTLAILWSQQQATAAEAKHFSPGRIIDDAVFYNNGAMSAGEIQTFLNAKAPTCDTNGTQPASDWGRSDITHATLASYIRNGTNRYTKDTGFHAPPYTCLKNFKQNTPQMEAASGLCSSLPARSNRTAAQIIKDVSDACGINPQVLLVLLQKEQSLITDSWPLNRQYAKATGFACPDTAPCDPKFNGFFYQVYHAARQFNVYKAYPTTYNYIAGRSNRIYWQTNLGNFVNPSGNANDPSRNGKSACGYSNVYIENQATAALYIYTPYQPNGRAMSNLYGTGDGCSAYGNRNFWRMFTDWFGSTSGSIALNGINIEAQPFLDKNVTASFTIKNNTRNRINLGLIKIAARSPSNKNVDFDYVDNLSLNPGQSYVYSKTRPFSGEEGNYSFFIARYDGTNWHYPPFGNFGQPHNGEVTKRITKSPIMSEQLSLSTSGGIHNSQSVTASFKITNPSIYPVALGLTQVAVRDSRNNNLDFPNDGDKILAPGETYTYQKTRVIEGTGTIRAWIANKRDTYDWSETFPASETNGMARSISLPIKDAVTLIAPLSVTMQNPAAGNQATATFRIKNHGTKPVEIGIIKPAVRDSKNTNLDFPVSPYLTLQPGQEYSYNQTRTLPAPDALRVWIANKRDAYQWSETFPASETNGMARSVVYNLHSTARLTAPLSVSVDGRTVSATFSLKNFSTKPVEIGIIKPAVRDSKNTNLDLPNSPYITLAPGQTYTYNESRVMASAAQLNIWIANKRDGHPWSEAFPISQDSLMLRQTSLSIQ